MKGRFEGFARAGAAVAIMSFGAHLAFTGAWQTLAGIGLLAAGFFASKSAIEYGERWEQMAHAA